MLENQTSNSYTVEGSIFVLYLVATPFFPHQITIKPPQISYSLLLTIKWQSVLGKMLILNLTAC